MFGLQPRDGLLAKVKHRLNSTVTRPVCFGGNISEREHELQINRGTDSSQFRFEVAFCQTVDPMRESGSASNINTM